MLLDLDRAAGQYPVVLVGGLLRQDGQLGLRQRPRVIRVSLQHKGRLLRPLSSSQLLTVFLDQVRSALDRVVYGEVGKIEEEGAFLIAFDEAERLICQTIGQVIAL